MRQSVVDRSVLVLCVLFVGACIGFALAVESGPQEPRAPDPAPGVVPVPAADVTDGARLYAARCERCHDLDEALQLLREAAPGVDARAAYLAMLQRHRKSSADENGPITDYLQSKLAGSESPAD